MPEKEQFLEGVAKEKIEKRAEEYNSTLSSETVDKNSAEYIKAQDVIDEILNLLKTAKPEYSFVESLEIEKRIKYYQTLLKYLDKDYLLSRKGELEKILADERKRLEDLEKEGADKTVSISANVDKEFLDKAAKELEERIANREAMIAGRGDELPPESYKQLEDWKKELADYREGNISDNILKVATNLEILSLTSRIANREAMIAGRGDKLPEASYKQLKEWKDKLSQLQNPTAVKENSEYVKLKESIAEHERELKSVNEGIEELEKRDPADIELQKRVVENRINELEDINKEKELFKINEKGEVIIDYPNISYEVDKEAMLAEYDARRKDMIDKYYGNRQKAEEYDDALYNLRSHIVEKEFTFVDADGKTTEGKYLTVEPYEEMEEELALLQLEEYAERLERLTKSQAGDQSVYDNVYVRDKEGKFVKLSPEEAYTADDTYVYTYNNAYNRKEFTYYNLKTLGKYGEKVPYTQLQEKQPIRNIARAVGNAMKAIRNTITAPVNRFVGSKIVAPIYGFVSGYNKGKVAGLYSNKMSHRYVARREYFEEQGKGYFASRFNAIFKAKEGNKAVLSAGAYDIQQSLRKKYSEIAQQIAFEKKTEFASKSLEEKIAMIQTDLDKATSEKDKEALSKTMEDLIKAKEQVAKDRAINAKTSISQTIQTDAVDYSQHDIANKENVTRTITGIKVLSRLGIRKLVGPKIKDWLLEHTKKVELVKNEPTQEQIEEALNIPKQKWVETTYTTEEVDITELQLDKANTMSDVITSNAGKQVKGFETVWGGEKGETLRTITGKENVTAIFQKADGVGGVGLSDTAELKAPVFTDGTFASELIDANGVLKQDVTIDQILTAVGNGAVKPEELSNVYVSIGDRYWTKLSELCKDMTHKVVIGSDTQKIILDEGHFEALTDAEKALAIEEALKNYDLKSKVDALTTYTTNYVDNERVVKALKGIGIALNGVDAALLAEDVYENVRETNTPLAFTKPEDRNYETKTQFTGIRRKDIKQTEQKRPKSKDEEER